MAVFDRLRFDDSLKESPRIKGSRISAIQLYEMFVIRGLTHDEISEMFEGVDEEDVKEAIKYCISHPDVVREQATSELTKNVVERQSKSKVKA